MSVIKKRFKGCYDNDRLCKHLIEDGLEDLCGHPDANKKVISSSKQDVSTDWKYGSLAPYWCPLFTTLKPTAKELLYKVGKLEKTKYDVHNNIVKLVELTMSSTFTFGKYRGRTVRDVLRFAPDYLKWLEDNKIVIIDRETI